MVAGVVSERLLGIQWGGANGGWGGTMMWGGERSGVGGWVWAERS
jgi:hypothetical protein